MRETVVHHGGKIRAHLATISRHESLDLIYAPLPMLLCAGVPGQGIVASDSDDENVHTAMSVNLGPTIL